MLVTGRLLAWESAAVAAEDARVMPTNRIPIQSKSPFHRKLYLPRFVLNIAVVM